MSVHHGVRVVIVAVLALLVGADSASAATDHVVITGGAVVPPGQTAGDVIVVDGAVTIAGHATGDVISVSGPVRVSGRIDGDLIAVSDRAVLGPTARVGGDVRYGDERPVLAGGARVDGKISNEDWADAANGWGWVSLIGWWLAVSVSTLIVVAYTTSAWVLGRRVLRNRSTSPWAALFTGWAILRVLALIPVAGALVGLAATVVGLGALAVALWRAGRPGATAARPEAPVPGRPAPAA
jgi:hypothetical protein